MSLKYEPFQRYQLLPSEEGTTEKGLRTFTRDPNLESDLDCLTCAEFARQRCPETRLRFFRRLCCCFFYIVQCAYGLSPHVSSVMACPRFVAACGAGAHGLLVFRHQPNPGVPCHPLLHCVPCHTTERRIRLISELGRPPLPPNY